MPDILYHVSDVPGISRFEPRLHSKHGAVVWAVDREHLHNYLLPRDCPRVTFHALPKSASEDVEQLMGGTSARCIVAIESGWMPDLLACRLHRYDLPSETFTLLDAGAGYYISRQAVTPQAEEPIPDVLGALLAHDVELRVMPSLWKLREAVIRSTLQFSIIRMRNAAPPEESDDVWQPVADTGRTMDKTVT